AVPLEQYDQTVWGKVAAVYTTLTDVDGPLRMLLKKRPNDTYFALITPAGTMTADTAMPTYTKRWRIENFFAENAFLGKPSAFPQSQCDPDDALTASAGVPRGRQLPA